MMSHIICRDRSRYILIMIVPRRSTFCLIRVNQDRVLIVIWLFFILDAYLWVGFIFYWFFWWYFTKRWGMFSSLSLKVRWFSMSDSFLMLVGVLGLKLKLIKTIFSTTCPHILSNNNYLNAIITIFHHYS